MQLTHQLNQQKVKNKTKPHRNDTYGEINHNNVEEKELNNNTPSLQQRGPAVRQNHSMQCAAGKYHRELFEIYSSAP